MLLCKLAIMTWPLFRCPVSNFWTSTHIWILTKGSTLQGYSCDGVQCREGMEGEPPETKCSKQGGYSKVAYGGNPRDRAEECSETVTEGKWWSETQLFWTGTGQLACLATLLSYRAWKGHLFFDILTWKGETRYILRSDEFMFTIDRVINIIT